MPLFKHRRDDAERTGSSVRSIPALDPDYLNLVHGRIIQSGGNNDSKEEVAAYVANAIFNTGATYFARLGNEEGLAAFRQQFEARSTTDTSIPDAMIDWLVSEDVGNEQWLTTLLNRLQDVAGKPPPL